MIKFLGAALIVTAAGAAGLSMAHSVRREVQYLQQLFRVLEGMMCEIPGRMATVEELFSQAETCSTGALRDVFHSCMQQIRSWAEPDVVSIMGCALDEYGERLSPDCAALLRELGQQLGAYDLQEQLRALEALSVRTEAALTSLRQGRADRCRSYEVLGVCAGCALAIILL